MPHGVRVPGNKALIGSNLASLFTDEVLEQCRLNNIFFICQPRNPTYKTTHQPIEVSFFWASKNCLEIYSLEIEDIKSERSRSEKSVIPTDFFKKLWKKNLVIGFKATGIFPFSTQRVLNKLQLISIMNSSKKTIKTFCIFFERPTIW